MPQRQFEHSNLRAFNIGPLPLVWPFIRRLNVAEIVDAHCPADPQAEFSHGHILQAMIACRLYNPVALYRVEDWARQDGAEHFLGIPADKLNDDRLGRTLDAVWAHRDSIMAQIACHTACEFELPLSMFHYDPTHFLFYGDYDNQRDEPGLLKVNYGRHSGSGHTIKEAQVGVNVANDGLGSVPIFFTTGSGNENHRTLAARNLEEIQKHLKPKDLLLVEDRGCFTRQHVFKIDQDHLHFISALPWNQDLAQLLKTIPLEQFQESSFLSIAERKKRDAGKPPSTWESHRVAERSQEWKHPDAPHKRLTVRIIFVYSSAEAKTARRMREKYVRKIRDGLARIQSSVAKGCRNTDPDSVARRIAPGIPSEPGVSSTLAPKAVSR